MKSDVINIDSRGNGFREAIEQTGKTAAFAGLDESDSISLQLLTEEVISLVRSITGEVKAAFWLESNGKAFELHVSTETVMDSEKRRQLIESSTSRKNEASKGFLGRLRDAFEEALVSDAEHRVIDLSMDEISTLPSGTLGLPDWDEYERSILKTVADQIKISIRGGKVEVIICKDFSR